jgi:choline dehydrogenase-like flavoprotein
LGTYDHIVIGAGSAGCAVAARLSEDPHRDVLLLEAGGSDLRLGVRAPLAFSKQFHTRGDWEYYTEPEPGCANRRIFEPRGKVIGGCSSMNAMLWIRGCPEDYDSWGVPGWSWADVEPVFRKIEDHHLQDGAHGHGGPVRVIRMASPDPVSELFVKAAIASGEPASDDLSGPELHGAGISPVTVWKGRRWSAARAYLDAARKRPNLTVVSRALAHRVLIRDGRAVAVEFERRGRMQTAEARGDIVLSAGAFGTPHLLQLSGVGDAGHLREIGVSCVVDNPAVGAHLAEHPLTLINWELGGDYIGLSDATNPKYLLPWLAGRGGKLASNVAEALAHVKTQPQLRNPDFQLVFGPVYFWKHGSAEHPRPAIVLAQSYWTPRSRGFVRARSSDPREKPAVQLGMFTERADVEAMIRAIRISRRIAATAPLASVVGAEINPGSSFESDEQLEAWIRAEAEHTYHPACTARIGALGDGVLDPELHVHGVNSLRVADASALPVITRANTNAPAIMIGERCAELIRRGAPQSTAVAMDAQRSPAAV